MLRRRPDPLELAAVLRRLESLRVSAPESPGWLPSPPPEPQVGAPVASVRSRVRVAAFDPGRRGVVVLAVVALLAAAGGAWYFVRAAPKTESVNDAASVVARPSAPPPSTLSSGWPSLTSAGPVVGGPTPTTLAVIVVDVVGRVAKPGIVTVPAASRIFDAIAAAGGALPGTDLTALDLAGKLIDGEEIFVGIPPPSGSAAQTAGGVVGGDGAAGTATGSSAPSVVDLNSATLTDLETLPGVGAVTAQRIIDWRAQHGRFTSVVQLQQISGIGPSKYAALLGRVKA
jgi:competence protein ComEA